MAASSSNDPAPPAAATELYGEPMLLVPIRRTFQLYKGVQMNLVRGGPEFERDITCAAQAGKLRYVAEGANIHAMTHHKPLWTKPHNAVLRGAVLGLVAIDDLLFSFGDDGRCAVFGGRTGEQVTEFTLSLPAGVRYTCGVIPPHFKNKVLIGCSDGAIRLYNFASGKLLFTWAVPPRVGASSSSSSDVSVTCLNASAYRGIVAIGTSDAQAIVYHFEKDVVLATFVHDSSRKDAHVRDDPTAAAKKRHRRSAVADALRPDGADGAATAVTAIAFRGDDEGRTLATGNALGEVAFWDLKEKRLAGAISGTKQVKGFDEMLSAPHKAAVHTLYFIPGKPLMVSAGGDNSMIEFRLDTLDGLALAIRQRCGHTGRCATASFYNNDLLVTAGAEDRAVRVTHIFSDRASWEMSQGKLGRRARDQGVDRDVLRLPPVSQLVCTPSRNYQWASIVTVHDCSAKVCGWRLDTRALENKIEPIKTTAHNCTAVSVSECGNFAVVGYSSGHVARVNLQDKSLLHFYAEKEGRAVAEPDRAHPEGAKISGTFVFQWADLAATCAADGTIRTWRLTTGKMLAKVKLPAPVQCLTGHRTSLLLVAGCSDFKVRVVSLTDGRDTTGNVGIQSTADTAAGASNVASATVSRTLSGHVSPITAVALSPDSLRHLVTSGSDGSLLVWDLAAARCIGQYRLPSPATSLSFHPDALFLCTTHASEPGAFLWTNRLRYGHAPEAIEPVAQLSSCPLMHFPRQEADTDAADGDGDDDEETSRKKQNGIRKAQAAAAVSTALGADAEGGIRTTKHTVEYWDSMSRLDQIRERNEPLLPPKKAAVPFFLPTTSELKTTFIVQPEKPGAEAREQAKKDQDARMAERFGHFTAEASQTEFGKMLAEGDFDGALDWMVTASGALIDLRVKSLLKEHESDDETGVIFAQNERAAGVILRFVAHAIRSRRHFDMVQAFVKLVFQGHGELLANHPALRREIEDVQAAQRDAREHFHRCFARVGCLTATFANAAQ